MVTRVDAGSTPLHQRGTLTAPKAHRPTARCTPEAQPTDGERAAPDRRRPLVLLAAYFTVTFACRKFWPLLAGS